MRAQRDTVHPASRRASPARRNSPALDSCEPTWRNASPGDITETTPPGVGRPRGWRHRPGEGVGHPGHGGAASRVAAPAGRRSRPSRTWRGGLAGGGTGSVGRNDFPGGGGLAGGRRGRHDRGHPDRLGRSSLSSSTTASTSVRPGPPGTAAARTWGAADDEDRQGRPGRGRCARRRAARGRRPADRAESSAGCALPPISRALPPVSARREGRAGARTCARGRPWGNLALVRATARVRTSLLLSRRGGA